jgi:hypothetical protein
MTVEILAAADLQGSSVLTSLSINMPTGEIKDSEVA